MAIGDEGSKAKKLNPPNNGVVMIKAGKPLLWTLERKSSE